jgi:hypothetical protein
MLRNLVVILKQDVAKCSMGLVHANSIMDKKSIPDCHVHIGAQDPR